MNSHEAYDNLFVAQLKDLTTFSEEISIQNIYTVISHDSHHFHWLNFCFDICSEFVSPKTRKNCVTLYVKSLRREKKTDAFQNSLNFFRKPLCEIIC